MERGTFRGFRRQSADEGRRGQTVASATSITSHTGVTATTLATGTDITGLLISFAVLLGETVEVEATVSFAQHSAAGGAVAAAITDAANTGFSENWATSGTASAAVLIIIKEQITSPGTYTRKVRFYKGNVAGSVSCGLDSRFQHYLKASVL